MCVCVCVCVCVCEGGGGGGGGDLVALEDIDLVSVSNTVLWKKSILF